MIKCGGSIINCDLPVCFDAYPRYEWILDMLRGAGIL